MNTPVEPIFIQIGRRRYQVPSLAQASEMYCAAGDASGLDVSSFPEALIVTADGRPIARISYNGIVWPAEEWRPGIEPLYNNGPKLEWVAAPATLARPAGADR